MTNFLRVTIFLLVLSAVFVVFGEYWPLGDDYFFTFREVTESFLRGETRLYDSNSVGFYNAPWTILVILPTVFMSLQYGEALLIIASLLGMLVSVAAVSKKNNDKFTLLIIALAIVNLYMFDLLTRGNIDGLLVLGIGLGWFGVERKNPILLGIGLWLLSIKPLNVVLPTLVFMKAIWHWPGSDKLKALAPLGSDLLDLFSRFRFRLAHPLYQSFSRKTSHDQSPNHSLAIARATWFPAGTGSMALHTRCNCLWICTDQNKECGSKNFSISAIY